MNAKHIDYARKALVAIMAFCAAGCVLCEDAEFQLPFRIFVIGVYGCLVAAAAMIIERFVRWWKQRFLTPLELVFVGVAGLAAWIALFPLIGLTLLLYNSIGFSSSTRVLSVGVVICLLASVVLLVAAMSMRFRQDHSRQRKSRLLRSSAIFGIIAVVGLSIFLSLRGVEGQHQHRVVESLKAFGGRATYDYQVTKEGYGLSKSLSWAVSACFVPCSIMSSGGEDFFHRVVRVDMGQADVDVDELLSQLRSLPELKYLILPVEIPWEKARRIEEAFPLCEVHYTAHPGNEFSPWEDQPGSPWFIKKPGPPEQPQVPSGK